jgi:hypothetical protein
MTAVFRLRRPFCFSAVCGVLVACGLTLNAAVLPLSLDLKTDTTGPEAGLLPPDVYVTLPGRWVGHTRCGRDVKFDLRVSDGSVAGNASLPGLVTEASAPLPMAALSVSGRTLVFRVTARACGREATYGVLTFESANSARLDLQSESSPITVVLTKVG